MLKIFVDNKNSTYMTPFVMTLRSVLCLHRSMSLVEFRFLQVEASCSLQNTICFDIVKEKCDFAFSPSATGACLLNIFLASSAGCQWSVMGGRRGGKVGRVMLFRGFSGHVVSIVVSSMVSH